LVRWWPGVVFRQRPDLSFESVSPQIEALTGLSAEAWCQPSRRFWQVVHEFDAEGLRSAIAQAGRTDQPVTHNFRVRHLHTRRISHLMEHRLASRAADGTILGYEGVWLDVTRQTVAESRLATAAWKETLAVLTMGLAHDFNNIIAGIHSLSETYLSQSGADHPFREGLELIRKNSLQASQLVHRIVQLHLGKAGKRNYHDLNQVIAELQDLVRKIVPRRIQLTVDLTATPLPVYVDAFELWQTVINLAMNAADAMPQNGQLRLRTALATNWRAPDHFVGTPPRLPAVCLSVEDNGCGIKPQHLRLIFDPFFTTKSVNKGSGLGLYNARVFVEKHQGALAVDSKPGAGCLFRLWLPQTDFSEAERDLPARTSNARRGLILMGELGNLREDVAELLRASGFHALIVGMDEDVGGLLRAGEYPYTALVLLLDPSDISLLPRLIGWRRAHPGLKVIVQPIGCGTDALDHGYLENADWVIPHDLSPELLCRQLNAILQTEADR
jgi:signal transduction histidine kinase